MANHANLINDLSPIYTSRNGILLSAIHYPSQLYANRSNNKALDVLTKGATFENPSFAPQPYLDVLATYDQEQRHLALAVVNRCKKHR